MDRSCGAHRVSRYAVQVMTYESAFEALKKHSKKDDVREIVKMFIGARRCWIHPWFQAPLQHSILEFLLR